MEITFEFVLEVDYNPRHVHVLKLATLFKGEVSPNNNVDWVSRKQVYEPNSKSLSRFE